jgi:hypothetical protein
MAFNEVPRGLGRQTETKEGLSAVQTVLLYIFLSNLQSLRISPREKGVVSFWKERLKAKF